MTTKTNIFMKRVMPLAMALLMVLSVVLVPVSADAAEKPYGPAQLILKKDQTYTLNIGGTTEKAKLSFKTSKKSVATVSKKGKIKAKKKGKATITTTIKQGGKTYKVKTKVTVKTKLTTHDVIVTTGYDFCELYNICVDCVNANGWAEDETTVEFMTDFEEMVYEVQAVAEDADVAGSEEALAALVDVIEAYTAGAEEYLPYWMEPYEG